MGIKITYESENDLWRALLSVNMPWPATDGKPVGPNCVSCGEPVGGENFAYVGVVVAGVHSGPPHVYHLEHVPG